MGLPNADAAASPPAPHGTVAGPARFLLFSFADGPLQELQNITWAQGGPGDGSVGVAWDPGHAGVKWSTLTPLCTPQKSIPREHYWSESTP